LRGVDGVYRWWLDRGVPIFDACGNVYKWFGTCTDIHNIKETEKALLDSERQLQFTLQTSHTGGWDLNLVDYTAYRTLEHDRIFGYESLLPEWNYQIFLEHIFPEDRNEVDRLFQNAIATQNNWDFECRIRRVDGALRWIWASGKYLLSDDNIPHMAGIVQDITDRKKAEETIYELGYYDPLTRLPNRRLMLDRLKQALISRTLKSRYGAILFIDLNHFKILNDTKGHDIGDLLLIEVTKHLQAAIHEDDTVARIGGDEFVVILDSLDRVTDLAAAQAESVAKRILVAIGLPFNLQGYEYRCSASIGIALFHSYEISIDDLVKQADMAMDQAKQVGGNAICFFDPAIQTALEFRVQLEAWMCKALQDEYRIYFQIQVDDESNAIGAEVLIRWHHPEQGLISPADFIPLAEETGLILPIGQWILETACTQLKAWEQNQNTRHLVLAVNISAKQFNQPDFVKQVLTVLEQTGANPDKLKLELTESMLVHNIADIIAKMNALKIHGIRFSLDDFGTGFSSLSYLKRLPFNQLKIDQSFVRDALTDSNDAAIIRTIIDLGQSLGMDVIAEGVETEQQRNFLATHGCKHYQGYLFSKPLPLEEFEQLLCNKA
jgi:diguanylate cyclase (GGDEF)-like protein/PAS domain S-box-containing protein